jgi:SAM-dependent methyltransferase
MNHTDHVNLIREGIIPGVWADFGSGGGAFTLALADLLGKGERTSPGATIHSVDRDAGVLAQQRRAMQAQFPAAAVTYHRADFTHKLDLPPLDGIIMANSLHFVRHKTPVLALIRGYLKPGGRLVIVEYNTDRGNTWVPYPFSFASWEELAQSNGFVHTRLLRTRSGSFLDGMYSALSMSP